MTGYLERSHAPYSTAPLVVTYLILAVIVSSVVVGISLLNESTVEIVNGLPFATDIPGIDGSAAANTTERGGQPRSMQTIRFVRLVPVSDQPKPQAKVPSEVYSLGRQNQDGSALPTYYCRVFSESDLMSRLVMGTIYYTIY